MKELTTEEKAKAYDKSFKIAQELYNNPNSSNIGKGYVCTVFPELKESEDEKIRNEIILYIGAKDDISLNTHNKWLSWLEKQGEKPQGKSALEAIKEEKVDSQNCVKTADNVEPKPYFYCKYGGTMPLCSDCIRNHNNSSFKTEEISTWYDPQKGTKQCIDFIQQKQL